MSLIEPINMLNYKLDYIKEPKESLLWPFNYLISLMPMMH